jgi:hypothetical protein
MLQDTPPSRPTAETPFPARVPVLEALKPDDRQRALAALPPPLAISTAKKSNKRTRAEARRKAEKAGIACRFSSAFLSISAFLRFQNSFQVIDI